MNRDVALDATLLPAADGTDAVAAIQQRRHRTLELGAGILIALCVLSGVGHFVYPDPNAQHLGEVLQAPSLTYPFGTDELGRNVFARTLAATFTDLGLAITATYLGVIIGTLLGTTAGYFGGWTERIVMRITDVVLAFPFIVLVIAIIVVIGPGTTGVFVGLVAAGWAVYARLARAEMLVLKERSYVRAAQTLGFSHRRVMWRHAVPNLVRPSIVYSMSDIVLNILSVASLSFLGLGAQPPTPEWGSIIADGQPYLFSAWWITTLPGLVIVLAGIGFSLMGDGLADRLRGGRSAIR